MEAFKPRKNDLLMTYLKFKHIEDAHDSPRGDGEESSHFKVEVVKQKVEVDHFSYELKDIYISDELMNPKAMNVEEANEEHLCLICFSEFRNLVNLPCGHSCIGDACVKIYFENGDSRACPLCRKGKVFQLQILIQSRCR
jgi:hypothetical protein